MLSNLCLPLFAILFASATAMPGPSLHAQAVLSPLSLMKYVPNQKPINPDSVFYASRHTDDISDELCPSGLSVCPIANQTESQPRNVAWSETWTLDNLVNHGFNCPNFDRDLENCGGCSVLDATFNCSDISNAVKTSCVTGRCIVGSCDEGYAISYMQDRCVITND